MYLSFLAHREILRTAVLYDRRIFFFFFRIFSASAVEIFHFFQSDEVDSSSFSHSSLLSSFDIEEIKE